MYEWPEEIPWEEYIRLYYLESALKRLILECLSSLSDKWWKQRIPRNITLDAENRQREEEKRLVRTIYLHPIWYMNFLARAISGS